MSVGSAVIVLATPVAIAVLLWRVVSPLVVVGLSFVCMFAAVVGLMLARDRIRVEDEEPPVDRVSALLGSERRWWMRSTLPTWLSALERENAVAHRVIAEHLPRFGKKVIWSWREGGESAYRQAMDRYHNELRRHRSAQEAEDERARQADRVNRSSQRRNLG